MRRTVTVFTLALVAIPFGAFVVQPALVRAGHTTGFSGRTHLIVKEHNLKHLSTDYRPFGCEFPTFPRLEDFTREVGEDGSVSNTLYVVPAGRVFVATDISFSSFRPGPTDGPVVFQIGLGSGERLPLYPASSTGQFSLTGGLKFSPGSSVMVFATFNPTPPPCSFIYRVDVLGYETVDAP